MKTNLAKSTAIGMFMGFSIALIDLQNYEYGILIAAIICLISGVLSAQIEEYAQFYVLLAGLVSLPFFIFTNGTDEGFYYFLGAFFLYGTLSFSFTYAVQNALYNCKVIFKYFLKK